MKNCPFCGSNDTRLSEPNEGGYLWITCNKCEANGPFGATEEEAKRYWNGRTDSAGN